MITSTRKYVPSDYSKTHFERHQTEKHNLVAVCCWCLRCRPMYYNHSCSPLLLHLLSKNVLFVRMIPHLMAVTHIQVSYLLEWRIPICNKPKKQKKRKKRTNETDWFNKLNSVHSHTRWCSMRMNGAIWLQKLELNDWENPHIESF